MKVWWWISAVCLSVLLGWGLWSLFDPVGDKPPSGSTHVAESPQSSFRNIHMVEMAGERKTWEAYADRIEVFEEKDTIHIGKSRRQIQLTLYRDQDMLTCYADAAEIDNRKREVVVEGNLKAVSKDGTTVLTNSIRWLPDIKKLVTEDKVTIRREGLLVQGSGMEADLALEEVRLLSDISSRVEMPTRSGLGGEAKR